MPHSEEIFRHYTGMRFLERRDLRCRVCGDTLGWFFIFFRCMANPSGAGEDGLTRAVCNAGASDGRLSREDANGQDDEAGEVDVTCGLSYQSNRGYPCLSVCQPQTQAQSTCTWSELSRSKLVAGSAWAKGRGRRHFHIPCSK